MPSADPPDERLADADRPADPGHGRGVIALRPVETRADLVTWAAIKTTVVPGDPTTAELMQATAEPGRTLLLAELGGVPAGCGVVAPSSFGGRVFMAARVLPEHRRRGLGTALVRALCEHARALQLTGVNAFVDAAEPHSIAFVERLGLAEVDYQLEQVRAVGNEEAPVAPQGVELVTLEGRREELLRDVWPVAREGYADMPLPGEVTLTIDTWLREEATRPDGSFVALERGEPVGYAGLIEHAGGPTIAEHGLTVVRRDRRRRGLARTLKQAQLAWAARSGVVELRTWTQRANEAMQSLNRSLGYVDQGKVLTYQGPLPG